MDSLANVHTDATHDVAALAALVERRHNSLRELLDLAQQQAVLVESHDMDGLLVLLDQKQRPVDRLLETSRMLRRFHEQESGQRVWPDLARHAATQKTWAECDAMYTEIVRLEQASEAVLSLRREHIGQLLASGRQAKEVHAAYLQGHEPLAAHGSGHFDLREE